MAMARANSLAASHSFPKVSTAQLGVRKQSDDRSSLEYTFNTSSHFQTKLIIFPPTLASPPESTLVLRCKLAKHPCNLLPFSYL